MGINPGRLRHQVALQGVTRTEDEGGGGANVWATTATVWAAVEPLDGSESLHGLAVTASVSHRVTIRYRAGVTAKMRVVHRGRVFEIRAVLDRDERREILDLLCAEVG